MLLAACSCGRGEKITRVPVIPAPSDVELYNGPFCEDPGNIRFKEKPSLGEDAYTLKIGRKGVTITAGSQSGAFWGMQTLRQMTESLEALPTGVINDCPRYSWRGFMLDEARHFSGKERVKLILDEMARLKLNRFHWHLTDAQGWRIEIKKYPRLTVIGSTGSHSDPDSPSVYYTQDDIREIVDYAAERNITVIPEIDMPGHAGAACRSYPEYAGGDWFGFTFNPGKEETYSFLTDILREVAGLFPGKWLHIGGDEVSYGSEAWMENPDVKALMEREGLEGVKEVESYFMHRMADSVKVLGKTLVCWDDAFDVGLGAEDQVIMWWRHDRADKLRSIAENKCPAVLCPRRPLYFDFIQDSTHRVGREWDGFNTLDDVYGFPENRYSRWELSDEELGEVLGLQANMWTETMQDKARVDYMLFPRIAALAEAAWCIPLSKDYEHFCRVLEREYERYESMGLYYFDYRDPSAHPEPQGPTVIPQKPINYFK